VKAESCSKSDLFPVPEAGAEHLIYNDVFESCLSSL